LVRLGPTKDRPAELQRELWRLSQRDAGPIAPCQVVVAWLAELYLRRVAQLCKQ